MTVGIGTGVFTAYWNKSKIYSSTYKLLLDNKNVVSNDSTKTLNNWFFGIQPAKPIVIWI